MDSIVICNPTFNEQIRVGDRFIERPVNHWTAVSRKRWSAGEQSQLGFYFLVGSYFPEVVLVGSGTSCSLPSVLGWWTILELRHICWALLFPLYFTALCCLSYLIAHCIFTYIKDSVFKDLLILCVWMFCLHVCTCLVPMGARRGHQIPWKWSSQMWWASAWVLAQALMLGITVDTIVPNPMLFSFKKWSY